MSEQGTDVYCDNIRLTVGVRGSSFKFDKNKLLAGQSPINGSVQKVMSQSMGAIISHLAHYLTLAGCQGDQQTCDTLRCAFYWTNISTEVYNTVQHCQDCHLMGKLFKPQSHLLLLAPWDPLGLIAIHILSSILRNMSGNQFMVIIIDRYRTMTCAVPTPNIFVRLQLQATCGSPNVV